MALYKIAEESRIPLVGAINFGIIDRGSNLLQIRPSTFCNMSCKFCSVDGGPFSKYHKNNYIVDKDYLVKWVKYVIKLKEDENAEINIDSVGEPTAYPQLVELIKDISEIREVKVISMQTNGTLLTKGKIKALEKAGLGRINLSIHSLQDKQSKELFGSSAYFLKNILEAIKHIQNSKIELLLAPVWLPSVNDKEIENLIQLSKEVGCKIGIQKYGIYKYSRKMKEAKHINYYKFYKQLEEWEKKYNIKLKLGPTDFKIKRVKRIPTVFRKGEKIRCVIKLPGWMPNQMIGIAEDRCITINNSKDEIEKTVLVKITDNKNNIYLASKL